MDLISSLNLYAIFAIIGGIGFIFLLASLILGDIFDMFGADADVGGDGADFGLFDSRVIAVFMTAFGGFGLIAAWSGLEALGSSLVGVGGGVVFGGVVSAFGKFLISQQSSSSVSDNDLVGRTARVTVPIKPGQVGQVSARVGDERVEKLARALGQDEIAAGSIVKITEVAGDSVIVSTAE